jgi:hypothetical protein
VGVKRRVKRGIRAASRAPAERQSLASDCSVIWQVQGTNAAKPR